MTDRRGLPAAFALTLAALAVACAPSERPGEEPAELEIVDVEMAENQELDLSGDRKAARRSEGGGVLPSDYPTGLPVYKPSTIADIGQSADGGYVQFRSRDPEGKVKSWYLAALQSGGWSVETAPGGVLVAARGGARARITIEQPGPVSIIRVEY